MIHTDHRCRKPVPVPDIAYIKVDPVIVEPCPQHVLLFFVTRIYPDGVVVLTQEVMKHYLAKRTSAACDECAGQFTAPNSAQGTACVAIVQEMLRLLSSAGALPARQDGQTLQ